MAVSYFRSKDIKIFPATFRGNYSDSEGTLTRVFDPEAKFNSEYNYTHLPGRVLNVKSIVLDTNYFTLAAKNSISITEAEACYIHFVLDGYYFEVSGAELFDLLKNATELTLAIATRTTTIVEEGDIDNKRDLHYLTSYHYGDSVSLDNLMGITGSMFSEYRCTALAAETDSYKIPNCPGADKIGTASHASREDSSRAILQIKASGEFCYKNFASNLVPVYCQNYVAYLGSNGVEQANLEVGYEASAKAAGAVAIGFEATADGKDVIAIGDAASATVTGTTGAAIALGGAAIAANNSIVIGSASATSSTVDNSVVVGQNSHTNRSGSVLIGAGIEDASTKEGIIAVGKNAKVSADTSTSSEDKTSAVVIGNSAEGKDAATVAVGPRSKAVAPGTIAIGADAEANQDFAISIGENATSLQDGDVTIGRGIATPDSRSYQRTILGQYNDKAKDGSFVIATGTNTSNRKTSCTFNTRTGNDSGTVVYENFTVKPNGSTVKLNISDASTNISTDQTTIDGDVELTATKTLSTDNIKVSKIQPRLDNKSLEFATELDKLKVYPKSKSTATSMVQLLFDMAHPVNSIFQTVDSELSNASAVAEYFKDTFGVTSTWEVWGGDTVPLSAGRNHKLGTSGGKESFSLAENQLPVHKHGVDVKVTETSKSLSHVVSNRLQVSGGGGHEHDISADGAHAHTLTIYSQNMGIGGYNGAMGSVSDTIEMYQGTWGAGSHSHGGKVKPVGDHSHGLIGSVTVDTHGEHKHDVNIGVTIKTTGKGESISVMQPYTVCYMYKRIS